MFKRDPKRAFWLLATMATLTLGAGCGTGGAPSGARAAARRAESINNLKQIGRGMHAHYDAHNRFPARAIFDGNGQPVLSWRVAILPFLGEEDLYKRFKLDEPWDSEHNRELIQLMPNHYRSPTSQAEPGHTTYLAVVGEGLAFEGDSSRTYRDYVQGDGTSKTVMVVEADDEAAVVWTQPADWEFNPDEPMANLGNAHTDGFPVLLADGSVHFVPSTLDPAQFQAILTIAGGEPKPASIDAFGSKAKTVCRISKRFFTCALSTTQQLPQETEVNHVPAMSRGNGVAVDRGDDAGPRRGLSAAARGTEAGGRPGG